MGTSMHTDREACRILEYFRWRNTHCHSPSYLYKANIRIVQTHSYKPCLNASTGMGVMIQRKRMYTVKYTHLLVLGEGQTENRENPNAAPTTNAKAYKQTSHRIQTRFPSINHHHSYQSHTRRPVMQE